MPVRRYSYRFKRDIWMLSDEEFERIGLALRQRIRAIKQFPADHGATLADAVANVASDAVAEYEALTGETMAHPDDLYAAQNSRYGPDCHACGKPLRTPRAKLCAACGADREAGPKSS
jgi:rRNA maturation endonuclease Nob1